MDIECYKIEKHPAYLTLRCTLCKLWWNFWDSDYTEFSLFLIVREAQEHSEGCRERS